MTDTPTHSTPQGGLTAARYLLLLADLLAQRGVDTEAMLQQAGLSAQTPEKNSGWVTPAQLQAFLLAATAQSGITHLGMLLGRHLNFSGHGSIGYAGLTAQNADAAIRYATDVFPLVTSLMRLELRQRDGLMSVEVHPQVTLADETEMFLVETLISSIDLMGTFMWAQYQPAFKVDLAFAEADAIREQLGPSISRLRFEQPMHAIHVPIELLSIPFPLADSQAHLQARERCERELALLQRQQSFAARLLERMQHQEDSFPAIETLAEELHVTPRTIHRRLQAEGTGFRALANEARMARAKQMMLREQCSITETAHRLGYQDSANFTRAFRRHTGVSPREFLKQAREKNDGS
ncbi:MAG: helix-turn-helix domain-containing protein [Alcanivoracaceae bacterium]|nr:helix-turn-helix domain-containing protein [Alcanivoracaceae bacterium]